MTRRPDWHQRLVLFIADHGRRPWRPGVNDCFLFGVGWRRAVTGHDLLAGEDRLYTTIEQGFELAARHGWADHVDFVTQGLVAIAPARAAIGDLVTVTGVDGRPAMAGVGGAQLHALTPRGLAVLPLTAALRGWRL